MPITHVDRTISTNVGLGCRGGNNTQAGAVSAPRRQRWMADTTAAARSCQHTAHGLCDRLTRKGRIHPLTGPQATGSRPAAAAQELSPVSVSLTTCPACGIAWACVHRVRCVTHEQHVWHIGCVSRENLRTSPRCSVPTLMRGSAIAPPGRTGGCDRHQLERRPDSDLLRIERRVF